ncbi:BON domain-containing protein [Nitrosomonas halophila]|uniref:Osmotically-inducible protein Y n=1 Tax=Nitrosomonas halophila TaxID=44576 RepID=A0A1H3M2N4_9PROT|nr:BON domain-containing protein [Nitrosomonas halophila]SDY70564.1 hyperosmotically inducible protein [Nitrosomonas halophila]HRQ06084.1 BON domain-containing protein [Nitrosomonas halophila]
MDIKNRSTILTILLVSGLSVAGCGETADKGSQTKAEASVGTEIDDSVITTKVKAALLSDAGLESFDIKVETHKGEVQLSGFVESQDQIDRAIVVAQEVKDVKNVVNKINLKSSDTKVGVKIDDSVITAKVKAALIKDSIIKSTDINVVTRNGEVQLSGFVESQTQVDRAIEIAQEVEGVKNVLDEMSIKQ